MKHKNRISFKKMAFAFLTVCVAPLAAGEQENVPAETCADTLADSSVRELTINCLKETGPFDHFWQAAGSPRLGQPEESQVYSYLGAVPHQGIRYIRVQNILRLAKATNVDDGQYDFSRVMYLVEYLLGHDLEPFFCLSGFPEGLRFDFDNRDDVRKWHKLIRAFIIALRDRFGAGRLRSWYFELWNEPDISPNFKGSTRAMLNNYDATIAAIKDVDPRIRFGGPDTAKIANMFRDFFVHLESGVNALTGGPAVPPNYISFHVKGRGLQRNSVRSMIETELRGYSRILEKYPAGGNLPILITECDLVSEAQRPLKWRATSKYPAQLCRLLCDNYRLLSNGRFPLELQISDNAKAQEFEQRRLLTRFFDEETGRYELVKKTDSQSYDGIISVG